jgi:CubicO group peptidase (beta-lactamase class C family)
MKIITLFFTILLFSSIISASEKHTKAVDDIFVKWGKSNVPGASVGVFKNGKTIYARGYGMANLEYDIPNDADSVFRIGSTSKQFTAASIILLAQQGKLSLDDSLQSFFPEFPNYSKSITLRHLLNHTSGIRDYLTLADLKGLSDFDFYENTDVMQWLVRQSSLNFVPGEEYLYSNSGYWLLGQIVNQKSGMNMAEYANKEIFKPLRMHNTHFHNDHRKIVKKRASGYTPVANETYAISMTTLDMIGDGGVFTTINDIKKWDDAFYNSTSLNDAFWYEMTRQGVLNNGEVIDYAAGLFVSEHKGLKIISHGGAFVGFRAELLRFPEHHFSVAVFANRADARPSVMALEVADIFLKNDYTVVPVSEPKTELPPKALEMKAPFEQLTGDYEEQDGYQFRVSIQDDKLHVVQFWNGTEYDLSLSKDSTNTYQIGEDNKLTFTFTDFKSKKARAIDLIQNGQLSVWNRMIELDISDINLVEFVGDYYSKELDVTYKLLLNGEVVTVQIANASPMSARVINVNRLTYQRGTINFVRHKNEIVGFQLEAGRVKNLEFTKQ